MQDGEAIHNAVFGLGIITMLVPHHHGYIYLIVESYNFSASQLAEGSYAAGNPLNYIITHNPHRINQSGVVG